MRVAIDLSPARFDRGGSSVYAEELSGALTTLDDLEVIPLSEPGRRFRRGGVGWRTQVLFGDLLWNPHLMIRAARRAGAEVFHATTYKAPARAVIALVVTIHDLFPLTHPELFGVWSSRYARRAIPRAVATADRVITVSEVVGEELLARFPAIDGKVRVVPNGVSRRFAPASQESIMALRKSYGLERPFVLAVGTLEPRKNLPRLIAAFAELDARRPGALDLVLAGAIGWGELALGDELPPRVRSRVRFLGHVADAELPTLYSAAAVFAFPSLGEGFGLPPLEALACGCPVVASARPPMTSLLGEVTRYFDPLSVGAIATAIAATLRDPGDAALRIRHAGHFNWGSTAELTAAVYREARSASDSRRR